LKPANKDTNGQTVSAEKEGNPKNDCDEWIELPEGENQQVIRLVLKFN